MDSTLHTINKSYIRHELLTPFKVNSSLLVKLLLVQWRNLRRLKNNCETCHVFKDRVCKKDETMKSVAKWPPRFIFYAKAKRLRSLQLDTARWSFHFVHRPAKCSIRWLICRGIFFKILSIGEMCLETDHCNYNLSLNSFFFLIRWKTAEEAIFGYGIIRAIFFLSNV